jgi:hypothetical protein
MSLGENDADFAGKLRFWAGIVAIMGALVGMVGDICLLYTPNGGYLDGDYQFLKHIPNTRLLWGHYLGILAIPFEAAGIYLVALALRPLGKRISLAAALLGIYLIFPGIAYHASIYPMADAVRAGGNWVEAFRPFNEPLGLVFAAAFLLLMVPVTIWIARGKTLLPPWVALTAPLGTYLLWTSLIWAWPLAGNFLAPMGFNLSMAIFFAVIWAMRHRLA